MKRKAMPIYLVTVKENDKDKVNRYTYQAWIKRAGFFSSFKSYDLYGEFKTPDEAWAAIDEYDFGRDRQGI